MNYGDLIKEVMKEFLVEGVPEDIFKDAKAFVPGIAEHEIPDEELDAERKRLKMLIVAVVLEGPEKNLKHIKQWAAKN